MLQLPCCKGFPWGCSTGREHFPLPDGVGNSGVMECRKCQYPILPLPRTELQSRALSCGGHSADSSNYWQFFYYLVPQLAKNDKNYNSKKGAQLLKIKGLFLDKTVESGCKFPSHAVIYSAQSTPKNKTRGSMDRSPGPYQSAESYIYLPHSRGNVTKHSAASIAKPKLIFWAMADSGSLMK